jgi:serine/threonine protein kinase
VEILSGVRHPAVLPVLGFSLVPSRFTREEGPVVVADLMRNGTLADILASVRRGRAPKFWTGTVQSKFLFGIASALAAFHAQGIVYGGLTIRKVFVSDNFEPILGLSRYSGFVGDERVSRADGSILFVAPEILRGSDSGQQSDVYSYGVLLYLMFAPTAKPRFGDGEVADLESNIKSRVLAGDQYMCLPTIPPPYWNLIEGCWNGKASERPTFRQILGKLRDHEEYRFRETNVRELDDYQERLLAFELRQ